MLALNGCGLKSWAEVVLLEPFLPQLQELYLAANDFSGISTEPSDLESVFQMELSAEQVQFTNLRILDVAACKLTSWEQVLLWKELPVLEELILDGNPIVSVSYRRGHAFQFLKRTSLSSTRFL